MYLIWGNMLIKSKLPQSIQYPHTGEPTTRTVLGVQMEIIPGTSEQGLVQYVSGKPLTDKELQDFANKDYAATVVDFKLNISPDDKNRIKAVKYVTENSVTMVIYPNGKMNEGEEKIGSKFKKDPHIDIALVKLTVGLPMAIVDWLSKVKVQAFEAPELLYGDIMVAAKYNGEIKGMRIIKKID